MAQEKKLIYYLLFLVGLIAVFLFAVLGNLSFWGGAFLFFSALLALLLLTKPFTGLLVLIFLRPIFDRLGTEKFFQMSGFSLNYNSILGILALIGGTYAFLSYRKGRKALPAKFTFAAFLAFVVLSVFWSPEVGPAAEECLRIASIFAIGFSAFSFTTSKARLYRLLKVIVGSAVVPLFVALVQAFNGQGVVIYGEYFRRAYGTFFYPNSLAFFLVLVGALSLFLLGKQQRSFAKIAYAAYCGLIFFVLIETYTRGAWLAFLLFAAALGFLRFRKAFGIGTIILLLTYFLVPIPVIKERISDIVSLEPFSSLMWRLHLWQKMVPFFFQKPLAGYGLNSFQFLSRQLHGLSLAPVPEAHNDYLRLLIETGIIGLVLYLNIYMRMLVFYFKQYMNQKDKDLKSLNLVTALIIIVFLLASGGDNLLRMTALEWPLYALMGGLAALEAKKK